MARDGRRRRAVTTTTTTTTTTSTAIVAFAALVFARGAPVSAQVCYTNFERNTAQWAQGYVWSCCSDEPVSRIEFQTEVPNQFYDPVNWIVTDYGGSQTGYGLTRCDVSLATPTSYACSGLACVAGEPDTCYKNYQPPNAPRRLCLRGTCQATGNNAQCNSNVYIRFNGGGQGTDADKDLVGTVTFQTLIPIAFVVIGILFHAHRIMRLRRRSGAHVPFFTNTWRERPNELAPAPAPQAPTARTNNEYNAQSGQVFIPGQGGQRDTVIMFSPGAQPAPMAPQPREGPTNSSQSNYVTSQEVYYPSV